MYAPINGAERMECFSKLEHFISNLNNDPVIMGADFNCTTEPEIDRNKGRELDMRTARLLKSVIHRLKLCDAWRQHHGNTLNFTWGCGGTLERLDRIYISKCLRGKIKNINTSNGALACSDHSLVSIIITIDGGKHKSPVWCMNYGILGDDEYEIIAISLPLSVPLVLVTASFHTFASFMYTPSL
uniref:Uncharacterized protein LOC102804063 n=1 Tax=Saccoglossus kowalevskii TaxID=10224 RepID=A0ABM0LU46_SACKO|nr:PREDICTED: uncharacterized protein LOC102804063 [Saccoglossus kowalevskii]